jgi:protein-tyrosine phosphatase
LIDIHSHVLYGLDDGARTLEDSVAMLRLAAESGTTDIVATPHANLTYTFQPERIRERLAEVAAAAGGRIKVHSGCDFHLSYDNIQDAIENPRKYTIAQNCYLLVEFSDLLIFQNTAEIFARLQDADMIPVVTHPERNGLLRQRIDAIGEWVEAGACIQITAQSLLGDFGNRAREFCGALLDRGLVHFVASDAHDCERRPPRLDTAHAWLTKHRSEETAELLCVTNPRAAIEGKPVWSLERQSPQPRKWYQVWR